MKLTPSTLNIHTGLGSCLHNSCHHSKAASGKGGRVLVASTSCSAMKLMCGGLVWWGNRDAVGQVCLSGCSKQLQKLLEGWQGLPSTRQGWPNSCPRRWQSPAWECQVGNGTARFLTEPVRSITLVQLYRAVKPELTQAKPAPALANEHVLVCAWPRVSRKA